MEPLARETTREQAEHMYVKEVLSEWNLKIKIRIAN